MVFAFKFIEKGYEWGGAMRGGSRQDPGYPGRMGEGGLTPNTGPAALVPSPLTQLQMGQASGTALPPRTLTRRHAGTLSYHNVKIKGWKRGEKKKKDFPVFAAGGPWNTGWGLCPRLGPFGIKGEQQGAGGYRVGTSTGIMYRGGCPRSSPQ